MTEAHSSSLGLSAVARHGVSEAAAFAAMAAATAAVWGHTVDEIRIGELSAIPAGVVNIGLLARWRHLGNRPRAWLAVVFGLFWTITVIPYHVVPLVQGLVTWQNVSGLLRVVGGIAMAVTGTALLRNRGEDDEE